MIASLPMYWRSETSGLWRAFWRHVVASAREQGLDLPDLTAPEDIGQDLKAHWMRPDLALSMTCSLPFRTDLRGQVTYVGTLDFGLGGRAGHYHSVVIGRDGCPEAIREDPDFKPRLAFNMLDSQSGWAVTQGSAPFGQVLRFGDYVETGAHAASLRAVAEGRADIAYIDAVTWRLLQRYDHNASRVREIGVSIETPGLPLICAQSFDPRPVRQALATAVDAFEPTDPFAMGGALKFCVLDVDAYLAQSVPSPPLVA